MRARLMQSVWASCGHLVLAAAGVWEGLRPDMLAAWCRLFLRAAQAAERMQAALRRDSAASSLDSLSSLALEPPPAGTRPNAPNLPARPRPTGPACSVRGAAAPTLAPLPAGCAPPAPRSLCSLAAWRSGLRDGAEAGAGRSGSGRMWMARARAAVLACLSERALTRRPGRRPTRPAPSAKRDPMQRPRARRRVGRCGRVGPAPAAPER